METRRWAQFHRRYDDPESGFAHRLEVAQAMLGDVLDAAPPGSISLLDICAGEGRVVVPVLASHPRRPDVHAHLVDSDPEVCATARVTVAELHLEHVEVVEADAGRSATYVGFPRADVVIMSGMFHYFELRDVTRVARALRELCAPDAAVLWTFGSHHHYGLADVHQTFDQAGFREVEVRPHKAVLTDGTPGVVALYRMTAPPEPLRAGQTWFRFGRGGGKPPQRFRRLIGSAKRRAALLLRR